MKKSYDYKAEAIIVSLLTIIFLLLAWVGIKSSQVDKANHLTECIKQCYPEQVDEMASRFGCICTPKEE